MYGYNRDPYVFANHSSVPKALTDPIVMMLKAWDGHDPKPADDDPNSPAYLSTISPTGIIHVDVGPSIGHQEVVQLHQKFINKKTGPVVGIKHHFDRIFTLNNDNQQGSNTATSSSNGTAAANSTINGDSNTTTTNNTASNNDGSDINSLNENIKNFPVLPTKPEVVYTGHIAQELKNGVIVVSEYTTWVVLSPRTDKGREAEYWIEYLKVYIHQQTLGEEIAKMYAGATV